MRIDWRSPRTLVTTAVVVVVLVLAVSEGMLWEWGMWDYIGWGLLALAVLIAAAAVKFLAQSARRRHED